MTILTPIFITTTNKPNTKNTVMQIEIPVKLFVLPAIYDNVDAGIDHK